MHRFKRLCPSRGRALSRARIDATLLPTLRRTRVARSALVAMVTAGAWSLPNPSVASCGTAFCAINTDWNVQQVGTEPGWRFDARLEYIDQDQMRRGSEEIAVGEAHRHHDEVRTVNRNLLLSASRSFGPQWDLTVQLPLVSRTHTHIHNHHGAQLLERWRFEEAGDLQVLTRYQLDHDPSGMKASGLRIGVKLPTGAFDLRNGDGDLAERSLQPGTGTTDLMVGAYHQQAAQAWPGGWFAQALYQFALDERQDYRPGNQLQVDLGAHYRLDNKWDVMLQLNARYQGRHRGAEAETRDSGARMVAVSPGFAYAFTPNIKLYAFVQLPVYQHVNGVQLTADQYYVVGVSTRF